MNYISGASGFIGSRLARKIDAVAIPHVEIESFQPDHEATFYFLSAYGNMYGQHDVKASAKANVMDAKHVAERVSFMTYLSSSAVKLKNKNHYATMKSVAEGYLRELNNTCIIRPFSVTGVGEQSEHLIPTLIRSCLYGEQMDFVPWPTHDYIDVDDVVDAITNLSHVSGLFEVGSGKRYSNRQVLEIVEDVTKKPAHIHTVESMRPYDTEEWPVSAECWSTKTLRKSIEEMVERA